MRRGAALILLLVGLTGGCAQWQRAGTQPHSRPETTVPQLFDALSIYRAMGFIVGTPPLAFVASIRFLAGATPESTMAVFAMSLANRALSFRHSGDGFVAEYHVELAFGSDTATARQVTRDEAVRVHGFQETLRADESIIFQQFVALRPGIYAVSLVVRDRNSPAYVRQEVVDTVPRFQRPALGTPVPIYQGAGRTELGALPQIVVNPRAALPYASDSLRFYVEGYGMPAGTRLAARVVDPDSVQLWRDTTVLTGDRALASARLLIGPGALPIGRAELEVTAVGTAATVRAPLLVSLSDQWAITNVGEMANLLRYFPRQDLVSKLRSAPPDERATRWRELYKATDPVPLTPENEALDEYFSRLAIANLRFQEPGMPGWLTDRGEVFITLGEPDEVLDIGTDARPTPTGTRAVRWDYANLRLTLYFQDETAFGQYRLTPASRAEYQRALAQVRRAQ